VEIKLALLQIQLGFAADSYKYITAGNGATATRHMRPNSAQFDRQTNKKRHQLYISNDIVGLTANRRTIAVQVQLFGQLRFIQLLLECWAL
jgi:hypothetical protein